jgi:hypothetical protein
MGIAPGSSLVTPRSDLGLAFEELDLDAIRGGYVGLQIAPVAEVGKAFDQFRTLKKTAALQPRRTERNQDGSYQDLTADFETDTYACQEHGVESPVDERTAAAHEDLIDADMLAAELCRHAVIEAHEMRVIAAINAKSAGASAAAVWSTDSTDVAAQMNGFIQTFRLLNGVRPNAICMDAEIADLLMENQSILEKFVGASARTAKDIRLDGLAAALKLDEVIVANGVKNTAAAPLAWSGSAIWPRDKVLLFRKETSPNLVRRQFMRTIHWAADGSRIGGAFEEYEDAKRRCRVMRCRMDTTEKIIHADAGMVIDSIVS